MIRLNRWVLLLIILLACSPIASAFTVSQISVTPSGALLPGTPVTVSYTIQFAASGDETFPSSSTLDMLTELDNPVWTADLLLNDISNPQPLDAKKNVYLTGWILSYDPTDVEENLQVTLEGTVPEVSTTTDKTIVRIQELDGRNNVVTSSVTTVTRQVVNTGEITMLISARESDLASLRANIDEKAALDVDTAEAEQKYSSALAAVNNAKALPSSEYTAAMAGLTSAQTLITEGITAVNKAWAEKDVADAQERITVTDDLITFLRPNATSGDAKTKLTEITTKREIAAGLVTDANDEIFAGNYDRAREKAAEAYAKGNETYNDALVLKKDITGGWFRLPSIPVPGGSLLIIAAVVILIVGVVGYIIYRKRTRWDELG